MSHAIPKKPRTAVFSVFFLAFTMAGCATAPTKVATPKVAVPDAWQQNESTSAISASESPQDLSRWWLQFGDVTLADLMGQALEANPDLHSAQANLREARARRALTAKDLNPSVDASVSHSVSKTTGDRASGKTNDLYNAGFDASWEPDIFGGTRHSVRAAQADLEASEASLHDTQVSLVAEVALNYVELRAYQARLTIAKNNLARQEETLDLTSWRAQAGLTTELDVEQSRSNVAQTRAQIPVLETGMAEAEHRLAVLLGQPPAALHQRLEMEAPIPSVPERVVIGIPADTLRQRPDVRAAEKRLAAETARLDQAKAARYPSFRLSGSLGIEALSLSGLASAETVTRSLLGGLTAPIFDRGRIRRQIEIQSAVEEQALAAYENTILTALEDVENALVSLANTRRQQTALATAVEAARSAAQMARHQYAAGLTSYQTVLDSERTVLSVADNLKSVEAEGTSNLIRLYKALGGGWAPATVSEKTPEKKSEES